MTVVFHILWVSILTVVGFTNGYCQSQTSSPYKPAAEISNDQLKKLSDPRESSDPIGIPNDPSDTISFGGLGLNIKIFRDPSTNCRSNSRECHFFYTPIFQFEKSAYGNYPRVDLEQLESDGKLTMYLHLYTAEVKQAVLEHLNYIYKASYTTANLSPLPITWILVQPAYQILPAAYQYEMFAKYPVRDLEVETKTILADKIPLIFFVPPQEAQNIKQRIERGVEMNIHYQYIKREYSQNRKHEKIAITIDQNIKRDFTGGRSKVYASMSQLLDLAMTTVLSIQDYNYIESESLMPVFTKYSEQLLTSAITAETTLGEIQGDLISSYKLDENDELITPNVTTKQSYLNETERTNHTVLKKEYKKSKNINGSVGGKVLWGAIKGSGSGGYASTSEGTTESDRENTSHTTKSGNWEGNRVDPLKIKMYEVSASALERQIEVDVEYVIAGDTSTTTLSTIRSTETALR